MRVGLAVLFLVQHAQVVETTGDAILVVDVAVEGQAIFVIAARGVVIGLRDCNNAAPPEGQRQRGLVARLARQPDGFFGVLLGVGIRAPARRRQTQGAQRIGGQFVGAGLPRQGQARLQMFGGCGVIA